MNCSRGKPYEALHAAELERARALAKLTLNQFVGIDEVFKKNGNSTCLYISYDYDDNIYLWVLKQSKPVAFRKTKLWESYVSKHGKISVDDLFGNERLLRNFHCFTSRAMRRPITLLFIRQPTYKGIKSGK